ncbi:MAG: hypothetical protein M3P93_14105, partial [Actinomycetota bacterium]|nr:hypothetical protein [Actinomycetota bacterium]
MPTLARLVPLPCPDCSVPLPDPVGTRCPRCGLLLAGPDAARLYALDQRLAALRAERSSLLEVLRAASRAPAYAGAGPWTVPGQPPGEGPPPGTVPSRAGRTPQQVLLGLGALLVLVATTVFLAVVWLTIGLAGQAAVMLGLIAAAGTGAAVTARRGLGSTAATLAWLAAGLTAVAVRAGRDLGLPGLAALS